MKTPEYFPLLISPAKRAAGTGWATNVIALGFIVLMALVFTAPVTEAPSAYAAPLPMPEGLEPEMPHPAGLRHAMWLRLHP